MAQYLILIYGDETSWAAAPPEVVERVHAEHRAFQARNAGAVLGGNALHRTDTATSLRSDGSGGDNGAGGPTVTDGPFAETKEALGGYYLVEATDLDEAIAVARQVPAPFGGVEVRPIRVID
ncbi:hypothetical protein GCM10018790_15220 [Kitasatospora xanthocidica]|uniref:YciI family protein n=1 Tax=Kitasatospora xanthocidica TaxID=83382 RepID=UPI001672B0E9|nr:YciI family protein [Kitasatospora xanthocidica]GHF38482.1 hypothetical protein GCM10018790_15220 [Kitasatospora xanthocidica]